MQQEASLSMQVDLFSPHHFRYACIPVLEANSCLIPVLSRRKAYLCVFSQGLLTSVNQMCNEVCKLALKHRKPLKALSSIIKSSASLKAPIGKNLNQKFWQRTAFLRDRFEEKLPFNPAFRKLSCEVLFYVKQLLLGRPEWNGSLLLARGMTCLFKGIDSSYCY